METLASASSEAIYFHHLHEGHDERGAFSARGSPDRSHDDHPLSLRRRAADDDDDDDDDDDALNRSVLLFDPLGLSDDSIRRSAPQPSPPPPKRDPSPVSASAPSAEWWHKTPARDRSASGVARPQLSLQTGPSASPTQLRPPPGLPTTSDDPTSDARSPAADFLKAFASLHTVAQAPAVSYSSLSEAAQSMQRTSSADDTSLPPGSRFSDLGSSTHSLAGQPSSAATAVGRSGKTPAQLYASGAPRTPATRPGLQSMMSTATTSGSIRPDDEGARFGPEGRYLLGRAIGFGGFSTVRQGWDMGTGEEGSAGPGMPEREPHRVAIKVVQRGSGGNKPETDDEDGEAELRIWESLPAHPHLLPLLYHEDASMPTAASSPFDSAEGNADDARGSVRFLVMPYCDAGSLLDHVRREGFRGDATSDSAVAATPGGSGIVLPSTSLSRSASLRSTTGYAHGAIPEGLVAGTSHPRTGSGFVPRTHAAQRIFSDPPSVAGSPKGRQWSNGGGPVTSLSLLVSPTIAAGVSPGAFGAASLSAAGAVGLARRDSSVGGSRPRSRGLSMAEARQVMRQLVEGTVCLHRKASVRHGDLKLENVLGQRVGSASRQVLGEDGEESFVAVEQPICWRIADFGLARPLGDGPEAQRASATAEQTNGSGRPGTHRSRVSDTAFGERARSRSAAPGNRGGSLAYAPPETFSTDGLAVAAAGPGSTTLRRDDVELAADMWALGCILYALLSGRLPFSDSFEPRLQLKIQKAQWDMPVRLLRRAERHALANAPKPGLPGSPIGAGQRSSSYSFFGSAGASLSRTHSLGAASSSLAGLSSYAQQRQQLQPLSSSTQPITQQREDLSASVPAGAAPPRTVSSSSTRGWGSHDRAQSASVVVALAGDRSGNSSGGPGSVTGDAPVRSPVADNEEDVASDDDETIDSTWDGKSSERAAAREALKGLLEPDVGRRWNIDRLAACTWLRQGEDEDAVLPLSGQMLGVPGETDGDMPSSLRSAIAAQSRPSRSREPVHYALDAGTAAVLYPEPALEFAKREPRPDRPVFTRRGSSLSRSRPDRDGSGSRTSSPMRRAPSRGAARPGTSESQRSTAGFGWQPASPRFSAAPETDEEGGAADEAARGRRSGARPIAIAHSSSRGGSGSRSRSRSRHGYPREALIEAEDINGGHGVEYEGAQPIPGRPSRISEESSLQGFRGRGGAGAFSLHHQSQLHHPMPQQQHHHRGLNGHGHGAANGTIGAAPRQGRSMSRSSSVDIIGIRGGASRGRAGVNGGGGAASGSGSGSGSNSRSHSRPRLLRIVDDSALGRSSRTTSAHGPTPHSLAFGSPGPGRWTAEVQSQAGLSSRGTVGMIGADPNWSDRGTPSSTHATLPPMGDAAEGGSRGRGRNRSPLNLTQTAMAQRETATRSSTSRSRSRAPAALRNLLSQGNSSAVGDVRDRDGEEAQRGIRAAEPALRQEQPQGQGQGQLEQEEEEEEETMWWQRGRAREPKATRQQ